VTRAPKESKLFAWRCPIDPLPITKYWNDIAIFFHNYAYLMPDDEKKSKS
jgi:hypothetical protein